MKTNYFMKLLLMTFTMILGINGLINGPLDDPFIGGTSLLTISGCILVLYSCLGIAALLFNYIKKTSC